MGIFGRNNLSLVDYEKKDWQLKLLDAHDLFKTEKLLIRSNSNQKSVREKMLSLDNLLEKLAGMSYRKQIIEFFNH